MMFDSGIDCIIGLIFASVVLFCLVRRLSGRSSEDGRPELSGWVQKLVESKAGIGVLALSSLILAVSIGSIIGIVAWEAIKGIAGTAMASPKVFVAAIIGAAASLIGFALFALVLSLFGPILSVVYEEWTVYIAPVIGGTIGAAISGGLAVNVIYMVALGALTGGIVLLFFGAITARKKITCKGAAEFVLAGAGFGIVNGFIVAIIFKVLEVTVGLGWLLAG